MPERLTVAQDSAVVVRYGQRQAGAKVGFNPKKRGRPSHHRLLAFAVETGDLIGLHWRLGSVWSGARAEARVPELVLRLRVIRVGEITVRLDKDFWTGAIVRRLQALDVPFLLKAPNQLDVRDALGSWRCSKRVQGIFPEATEVNSNSGRLWDARLIFLEGRRPLDEVEDPLALDTHEVTDSAHVLTNIPGIQALTAWRRSNADA